MEQPYRVVATGAGYFLSQAWLELGGSTFIKRSTKGVRH